MSKYVIEIKPEYEDKFRGVMILGAKNSNLYVDSQTVDELEELNSDYINEHFSDLQDTAYQRGLEDGKKATWEATRKVIRLPEGVVLDLFTDCYSSVCTALQVFLKYEGSEVIEKLKAYEEKKADKIEVGDIIANNTEPKLKVWVTCFDEIGFCGIAITDFGTVDGGKLYSSCSPKGWHKIGHFDIDKILEEMRHD